MTFARKYKAELVLILLTILWGGTFVLIKKALTHVSPFVFVSFRFGLASLFLLPFLWKHLKKLDFAAIKDGLWIGILFFGGFILQTVGLQYTTSTKSAFITGTFVIFTPIFQSIIEKRVPSVRNIISIAIVSVGIILLSAKEGSVFSVFTELGETFNFGDFLTLLCAIIFGVYIVYLDIISKKHYHLYVTFSQVFTTFIIAIMCLPLFNLTGIERIKLDFHPDLFIAVGYTVFFATLITITLQSRFQKEVTPTKAAIIYSSEPLFATLTAYIIIGETLTTLGMAGAGIILAGLLFSELSKPGED